MVEKIFQVYSTCHYNIVLMKFGNTEIYYYFCEELINGKLVWINILNST